MRFAAEKTPSIKERFPLDLCWKALSHPEPYSGCLATGAALSGDDAAGSQLLTAKDMVALGIKFGVGPHTTYWSVLMGLSDQLWQGSAVVPGRLTRMLRQNQLPFHIHHDQSFQPMLSGALRLAQMLYPADEVTAHRALRQARRIHGYRGRTSPPPGHAVHDLVHHTRHIRRIKPGQKAIKRDVIGNRVQLQGGEQSLCSRN
jgi:hypothetical protein